MTNEKRPGALFVVESIITDCVLGLDFNSVGTRVENR